MPGLMYKDSIDYIKEYLDEYTLAEEFSSKGDLFVGDIKLGNKTYKVGGVFFDTTPNLIANNILKNYNIDILLLYHNVKKIVIFRKSEKVDIDLGKLAKQLSYGGGKPDVAGCVVNDKIISITKLLDKYVR